MIYRKGEPTLDYECSEAIETRGRGCFKCEYGCYRKGMTATEATKDNIKLVKERRVKDSMTKELTLKDKALYVIEGLTENEMNPHLADTNPALLDFLGRIFRYAHIARDSCPHPEWEKELNETYYRLIR